MKPDTFKSYRRQHKASILELAYATGVHWQPIARYELGEGTLPAETVEMLVAAVKRCEKVDIETLVEKYSDLFEGK